MSYKCTCCHAAVPSGIPMLRHVIVRTVERLGQEVEEIARELPVCADCKRSLDAGIALATLLEDHRPIAVPVVLKLFQDAVAPPKARAVKW